MLKKIMKYKKEKSDQMSKRKGKIKNTKIALIILAIILIVIALIGYSTGNLNKYITDIIHGKSVVDVATSAINDIGKEKAKTTKVSFNLDNIPEFRNEPYVTINDNKPNFEEKYFTTKSFENYSKLDSLGRCGVAFANIGKDIMPTSKREAINMIKPTGWQTTKYNFIDGKYLYNRCHLIGFQLAGENANEKNLITGTRYLNVTGMLPFENEVTEYVKKKNKHVLYRVTPIFKDQNLVASGVQIEAESVEDKGKSICFNVYVYNNQPKVEIDYKTGKSKLTK